MVMQERQPNYYYSVKFFLYDYCQIMRNEGNNVCSIKFRSKHSSNTVHTTFTTKFNGTDIMKLNSLGRDYKHYSRVPNKRSYRLHIRKWKKIPL